MLDFISVPFIHMIIWWADKKPASLRLLVIFHIHIYFIFISTCCISYQFHLFTWLFDGLTKNNIIMATSNISLTKCFMIFGLDVWHCGSYLIMHECTCTYLVTEISTYVKWCQNHRIAFSINSCKTIYKCTNTSIHMLIHHWHCHVFCYYRCVLHFQSVRHHSCHLPLCIGHLSQQEGRNRKTSFTMADEGICFWHIGPGVKFLWMFPKYRFTLFLFNNFSLHSSSCPHWVSLMLWSFLWTFSVMEA